MRFCFDSFDFVEKTLRPDATALIDEKSSLNWLEFDQEVSYFCSALSEKEWDKSTNPVILYGHKKLEMIVAIYGCMKLGVPYIPIDVAYPVGRIQKVIEAAEPTLLINCDSTEKLEISGIHQVSFIDRRFATELPANAKINTAFPADRLVYMIFTSGSTGEPKGVQISRSAVQSFVRWMTKDFGFSNTDVFINIALFSFDLSVFELMTFSALGASLLLNPISISENPELLDERITEFKGTVLVSTPSFSIKISRLEEAKMNANLKYFLFCGEVLPNQLCAALRKNFPRTKIYNTYGPTEATVATTLVEITDEVIAKYPVLPVGFSKRESEILIDQEEILIVGDNVSLGYVNRPDLNESKFFEHKGLRGFRTGDLGYIEDGMLFCKGRNDDQVKLHGYRIELNEITSKILEIDSIEDAATLALKRNGEVKKIVSLVVLKKNSQAHFDKSTIINKLGASLPEYMVPSDLRLVDTIPLNQNGKADKALLEKIYLGK